MKHFFSIDDIQSLPEWVGEARELKKNPLKYNSMGMGKTLGLLFFNNSLRTRLSTQKAALNLGMHVIVMNFGNEGWSLEFEDGTVMDQGKAEHIREAAAVVSQYCDIIGIRAFASLQDREKDREEQVLKSFIKYASVPILNLESATEHPLQAFADAITIEEKKNKKRPKVVLSWAPHPRPLPHAVANSFVKMMQLQEADFCITQPEGYELDPEITKGIPLYHNQDEALENADFVYVKNWSSFKEYGKVLHMDASWTLTGEKLQQAFFMHCLPVRRNMVVEDKVLDGPQSLVIEQANNRTFAAQVAIKKLLEQK